MTRKEKNKQTKKLEMENSKQEGSSEAGEFKEQSVKAKYTSNVTKKPVNLYPNFFRKLCFHRVRSETIYGNKEITGKVADYRRRKGHLCFHEKCLMRPSY